MGRPRKNPDAESPKEQAESTPSVEVEKVIEGRDIAAQVQQDAVANAIAANQAARGGDRHIVIGPGGQRFTIEQLQMDVRYPLANDSLVLAEPVKYGLIKADAHKPGYRYLWPKRLSDNTANMVGAGVYEVVPADETQPVPGAGISRITLPNGETGIGWKGHIMVRMSPENWDLYVNYWERLSWNRQIKQTNAPLKEEKTGRRGVTWEAEIKNKGQETVLIPT